MTGEPGSQALPSSITIEPSGVSSSVRRGARSCSHVRYSSPVLLPYFFLRLSGNGGEVKIIWTEPRTFCPASESRKLSIRETYITPDLVA